MRCISRAIFLLFAAVLSSFPAESDALAISANIQAKHFLNNTILDPIYASAGSDQIVGYTRCGDSALWTGHYLAAEVFRYKVTQSGDALSNARKAIAGLKSLVDVTGNNLLARCIVPLDSPYAAGIQREESANGIHMAPPWFWVGNTSRDQYAGVFLGLAVAYDLVPDDAVRAQATTLVTRLLDYLIAHGWSVQMPDGSYSTTFLGRPDQELALLQIGRHMNPAKYDALYTAFATANASLVVAPIRAECSDTYGSYYKFNLDYATFFDLVRLAPATSPYLPFYSTAYSQLRQCTAKHQNAHFNMIDRALRGANGRRDADTRSFLGLWLQRSRRDYFTDVSDRYAACGTNKACDIVAVNDRPNTDFLWQRSPQLLYGGGDGTIETAGIDYLLPYWMGRYYGVINQ
jgi:hypothetical protein